MVSRPSPDGPGEYRRPSVSNRVLSSCSDQVERVRRGQGRMHADVRALPVPGDTAGPGDADRPGLRAGGERMRVQTQGHVPARGPRTGVRRAGDGPAVARGRVRATAIPETRTKNEKKKIIKQRTSLPVHIYTYILCLEILTYYYIIYILG